MRGNFLLKCNELLLLPVQGCLHGMKIPNKNITSMFVFSTSRTVYLAIKLYESFSFQIYIMDRIEKLPRQFPEKL